MKFLLLAFFVAAATAVPVPDDSGPVEVVVNGVPEGAALDIADIVDIKVKEHVDGQLVSATNALHPFTAEGIAEAAAIEAAAIPLPAPVDFEIAPEAVVLPEPALPEVVPEAVILPEPAVPEVIPEPVVLPEPAVPEVVPEPVVLPEPAIPEVVPEPVVLPEPAVPEVVPEPVVLPEPVAPEVVPEPVNVVEDAPATGAQLPNGEIFNDGQVSVTVNTPEESGIIATIQSWFNMVMNYVNTSGAATTQQIV